MESWVQWGIGTLIAIVVGVIGYLAWRKPRTPTTAPASPPDLVLQQIGGLANQTGQPRYVRAQLRLVNRGAGTARNWQVVVGDAGIAGVKLARHGIRGPAQYASEIVWHQDATTGEVPSSQSRDLADFLKIVLPEDSTHVSLDLSIKADNAAPRSGTLDVAFPAGGQPTIQFVI
jgi:hypothetical protein